MTEEELILCAFRYCLGRSTYFVFAITEHIVEKWDTISVRIRKAIVEETTEAIERGHAGDEVDCDLWKAVLEYAIKTNFDLECVHTEYIERQKHQGS